MATKNERKNFGSIKEIISPPNLIEVQNNSYLEFLQSEIAQSKRKDLGLEAVFKEVFPIESYDGKTVLDYKGYEISEPKLSWIESLREGVTFGAALHVTFMLQDEKGGREEKVFMGEMPLMTPQGSFVINGAERVIVSQLHRSPGIAFEATQHPNGKMLHSFRIIPDRGSWYEAQFDTSDMLYVYLDRKKRRRKFLTTTFFRAISGLDEEKKPKKGEVRGTDDEIIKLFYDISEISVKNAEKLEDIGNKVLIEDVIDEDKFVVVARAFEPLSKAVIKQISELGVKKIKVVDTSVDDGIIIKCLKKDPTKNEEEALKDIYRRLRPGDPPTAANARALIKRLFFDPKRYDLGRVGRYKMNQKLGFEDEFDTRILTKEDLVAATKYLLKLKLGDGSVDDIDHLGSRRIRTVGELLANQCRVGLARTERLVKERMTLFDQEVDTMTPAKLINPKALSAVVRDFFGRSQLSQFMDQINPLAELTHKRRLSALGPGGLSRDRAGFEVRDVHPSHYGRICPIETPEGPNIGLIASLATFARVNDFGFIETPYRKVVKGRVTGQIDYLTGDREEQYIIAQANAPMDDKGNYLNPTVTCRCRGDFIDVPPAEVDYMDVSPKQLVSVAAGLIPFLEHDDANRALMGSNMQRQAVPLVRAEAPFVGTGMEETVARDSGAAITATRGGIVDQVDATRIVIRAIGDVEPGQSGVDIYTLQKFQRSNQNTCINQRPLVKVGDVIEEGDIIADGPSTDLGELALGKNSLVAFMPWNGYNYEDSILISERIVKDDVFTSIHIEEFEVMARDTKLGPEDITRDIPNVGEEALRNLDEAGIVYIGAEVHPGDILVGKITPKGESPMTPEEKLLRAIFGEKASDVRDTSLRLPPGVAGTIVEVRVFNRHGIEIDDRTRAIQHEEIERLRKDAKDERAILNRATYNRLKDMLIGQAASAAPKGVKKGAVITGELLEEIERHEWFKFAVADDNRQAQIEAVKSQYDEAAKGIDDKFEDRKEKLERGDELAPGVLKMVKVFVAVKRKLQPGDKMAGRHGNKGVISRILPQEDMPFLEDGTPVDIVLNPLGVPSRMNVGQIFETHLGMAARGLGQQVAAALEEWRDANPDPQAAKPPKAVRDKLVDVYGDTYEAEIKARSDDEIIELAGNLIVGVPMGTPVFDGAREADVSDMLAKAGLDTSGQVTLYDGRTGEAFDRKVTVGYIYMLKLHHLVDDKIHARSIGPYSLVTQQPLGGKAQFGGQRFGEMEVWALQAYGAAYTLQEMLTVKSDDVVGRTKVYEAIVKGDDTFEAGIPESFNVLVKEMRSLGLNVELSSLTDDDDGDLAEAAE